MKLTPFFLLLLAFCLSVPSVSLAHNEGNDNAHEGRMRYSFVSNEDAVSVKVKCYARKSNDSDDWDLDSETLSKGDRIDCDKHYDNKPTEYGYIMIAWHKNIVNSTFRTRRYYRGHCTDDHNVEDCTWHGSDTYKYGSGAQTRYYTHCESDERVFAELKRSLNDYEAEVSCESI